MNRYATKLRKVNPALRCLTVGTDVIQPVDVVRDLEVYFDSHLTMKAHELPGHASSIFVVYDIRRSLGRDVTKILHPKINIMIKRVAIPITGKVNCHVISKKMANHGSVKFSL